ncbi:MAG: hypothetical protein Q8O64_10335 [Sideroxyarcus sp.]|nr:hypothetical protein [Sideroxyarcus sp.]
MAQSTLPVVALMSRPDAHDNCLTKLKWKAIVPPVAQTNAPLDWVNWELQLQVITPADDTVSVSQDEYLSE